MGWKKQDVLALAFAGLTSCAWGSEKSHAGDFDNFILNVAGDCNDLGTVTFFQLHNFRYIDLGDDALGHPLFGRVNLQIHSNKTFWLKYRELAVTGQTRTGMTTEDIFETQISGQWEENSNGEIVLRGLGMLSKIHIVFSGLSELGLILTLQKDFGKYSAGKLKGQSVILRAHYSSLGPFGQSAAEYCKK